MQDFKEKIAVVTGAASGIGLALASRCAQEGMKVVLADIVEEALIQAEKDLKAKGADVLAVRTDVSKAGDVEELAQKTLSAFGAVHLLCNNAGVGSGAKKIWEYTFNDWKWVLNVNLWGVIHGIRIFVPIMLKQATPGHILNTASAAGLFTAVDVGTYKVSKHGIVALSEILYHELKREGANIKVTVLCPGMVNTPFGLQKRPSEYGDTSSATGSDNKELQEKIRKMQQAQGMSTDYVADIAFKAIQEERFYIITNPEFKSAIKIRMEDILQERNPINPFQSPDDYLR